MHNRIDVNLDGRSVSASDATVRRDLLAAESGVIDS